MAKRNMLVKVGENEFKALLNRDETIADVKEHLSPWLELLRDLSNYGSKLLPRCFSSSAKGLQDAVVLGTLLRQVVAMLDGVEVLLSNGATTSWPPTKPGFWLSKRGASVCPDVGCA